MSLDHVPGNRDRENSANATNGIGSDNFARSCGRSLLMLAAFKPRTYEPQRGGIGRQFAATDAS
jgi:hypothetical protein